MTEDFVKLVSKAEIEYQKEKEQKNPTNFISSRSSKNSTSKFYDSDHDDWLSERSDPVHSSTDIQITPIEKRTELSKLNITNGHDTNSQNVIEIVGKENQGALLPLHSTNTLEKYNCKKKEAEKESPKEVLNNIVNGARLDNLSMNTKPYMHNDVTKKHSRCAIKSLDENLELILNGSNNSQDSPIQNESSFLTSQEKLALSSWGLPKTVLQVFF